MAMGQHRTLGVILAGGRSARFGAADKAQALLRGRALLAHVADRLAPQVDSLAVAVAAADPGETGLGLPLLVDRPPAHQGPLAGLLSGLAHACATGMTQLVTVPCDAPALPGDLVAQLRRARDACGTTSAFARVAGRLNPVFALYDAAETARVREAYARGMRAPRDLFALLDGAIADFEEAEAFADIDTAADLAAAELRLSR